MGEEDNRRSTLDIIGDRITYRSQYPHEGKTPVSRPKVGIEKALNVLQIPAIRDWLVNESQVSDAAIEKVIDSLPSDIAGSEAVIEYMYGVPVNSEHNEPLLDYDRLIMVMCRDIKKDLENNNGKKFREIIRQTDIMALDQILGNEDLRDWLLGKDEVTVYDVEEAVVKATILNMATVGMDFLDKPDLDTPEGKN